MPQVSEESSNPEPPRLAFSKDELAEAIYKQRSLTVQAGLVLGNTEDVEEVLSDVVRKAVQFVDRDPEKIVGPPGPDGRFTLAGLNTVYLAGMVHNACIDRIRARRARPETVSISAQSEDDASSRFIIELVDDGSVEEQILQKERDEEAWRYLARLEEEDPQAAFVIRLIYFRGLKRREVNAVLNHPSGDRAKTLHDRALKAMRKYAREGGR